MKNWKKWGLRLLALILLIVVGFVIWGSTPSGPMTEAVTALKNDSQVNVESVQWLVFKPVGVEAKTGFIFYPGGRVDYRSYAPQARAIAANGYLVVIVPMPLNLAVFGSGKAAQVISAYPTIQHWVIGGHSLGGAMAAHFVYQHPGMVQGLVFWAAYPASSDSLVDQKLAVTSIYGTKDGLATAGKIDASRALLPAATSWVPLEGGNHGQFGWYGLQSGDQIASIDRSTQQQQIVAATVDLLKKIETQP